MAPFLLAVGAANPGEGRHLLAVALIIGVALIFDFCNGFHDSANSIATIVSTRVLPPKYAVLWAAAFNFIAVFIVGLAVAGTIATKIVDPKVATNMVVLAALVGAIVWDLITWWLGLPSSSSHALIGGFVGAGVAAAGWSVVKWGGLSKPVVGIVLAPTLCLGLGFMVMVAILWICRKAHPAPLNRLFKKLQWSRRASTASPTEATTPRRPSASCARSWWPRGGCTRATPPPGSHRPTSRCGSSSRPMAPSPSGR